MSTQIERSTATRARIVAVARAAFVSDGYESTSLARIAAEAGCTKGALYHHYDGKEALFAAVFECVARETVAQAGRRTSGKCAAKDRLKAAAIAWLDAVEDGDARVILLQLGPAVLGLARARALEDAITLAPLMQLVQDTIVEQAPDADIDALLATRLINSALGEIAVLRHMSKARDPDAKTAARAISRVVDGLLSSD